MEYTELADNPVLQKCTPREIMQKLGGMGDQYMTFRTALARVVAAKPHSADVERLISVYNKLKTPDRAALSSKTISNYLHVSQNMCDVDDFNPSDAALLWMQNKDRRSRPVTKAKQQEWYKSVFREARDAVETVDADDNTFTDQDAQLSALGRKLTF
jgi:hypothetical protein